VHFGGYPHFDVGYSNGPEGDFRGAGGRASRPPAPPIPPLPRYVDNHQVHCFVQCHVLCDNGRNYS
jgi:hypothetical protein